MLRSIILFPQMDNVNEIQRIRDRYDPLANNIAPHVTLVFPFESNISNNQLEKHIKEALEDIKRFQIEFKGITGNIRDGFIFLNVKKGNDQIIELHDKLYSKKLEQFLNRKITYSPHLTVGRIEDEVRFNNVVEELSSFNKSYITEIDKVYVELIDENNNSIIQFTYQLNKA